MERSYGEAVDVSSATDLEFGSLANSLTLLLEAAKTELEHDREAARTSLATASSILQSEVERRSGAKGSEREDWRVGRSRVSAPSSTRTWTGPFTRVTSVP